MDSRCDAGRAGIQSSVLEDATFFSLIQVLDHVLTMLFVYSKRQAPSDFLDTTQVVVMLKRLEICSE